jgi:hypothetical protein
MHAVVVSVTIKDQEAAQAMLEEQVVPRVKDAPGVVNAYWARSDAGQGGSMIVCESEEAARAIAEQIQSGPPANSDAVSLDSVEVREVVAHV